MSERRLLLVHAHPDDESIGTGATMAKYVAEGAKVTLITCTAGEEGEILVPELAHLAADREDRLADQRKIELENAMAALGVSDFRYLGGFGKYRDSGMQWGDDGTARPRDETRADTFWSADLTQAANDLVAIIREVRPQVLVTYNEFGGYGHPDHIQAHRVAMYAASLAAVRTYRKDLGEAWDIARIYWTAMSASAMREGLRQLRAAGDTTSFEGMNTENLGPFVVEDEDIDVSIDASNYLSQKNAALRAYPTQIAIDGPFFALSNNLGARVWGVEHFQLAKGSIYKAAEVEASADLFVGLNS